jgi:hypothetical protein
MHTILDVAMDGYLNIAQTIVKSTRATGQIHLPCTIEYAAIPDNTLWAGSYGDSSPPDRRGHRTTRAVEQLHRLNRLTARLILAIFVLFMVYVVLYAPPPPLPRGVDRSG